MSSNNEVLYDEDNDTPDWIEVVNKSESPVNLSDYFLSDNIENILKWQFPALVIAPEEYILIFASGKDRRQLITNWYTLIDINDEWKYIIPRSELPGTWKNVDFNDKNWDMGKSGLGYGDNDDNTVLPQNTASVYMRYKFTLSDLNKITAAWFHMDYDDGFIAYLNGTEIAREQMGVKGEFAPYNRYADGNHEARIYGGGVPESFNIDEFIPFLKEGENVLSVQVHNVSNSSSDMTAIPFLTLGYASEINLNEPLSEHIQLNSTSPHTNFKLTSSGETLLLTHSTKGIIDSVSYDNIPVEYSYGRSVADNANWVYFAEPTPGFPNKGDFWNEIVTSKVEFSVSDMFVNQPIYLVLSGAKDGEVIRYTTNAEEPDLQSLIAQRPINISKNTVVRARIFKPGSIPGEMASRTYIFDNKPTLPVVSISTAPDNLWDNETGIYVLGDNYESDNPHYGANFWEDWEKPAYVEMVDENGNELIASPCGIKIFGGWSRAHPQKSLSVFFRKEYGKEEISNIQLFESKDISDFKSLVYRNGGNDFGNGIIRDGMMTSLVRNMDTDISAFKPTIMYLNGEYWGIINMREKINEDYLQSNHGVDADSVDMIQSHGTVLEGTSDEYWKMYNYIAQNNLSENAVYEEVEKMLDISNYIDYQLSQTYFNNRDWPGNNIKCWRPQVEEGKWRYIMYDTDFGFSLYDGQNNAFTLNTIAFALQTNGPGWPNPPWSTLIFRKLLTNTTFRNRFINRYADMLNTTFVAESVVHHIDSLADIIEPEISNHYNKWYSPNVGYWNTHINKMRTFADNRVSYTRQHIIEQFGLRYMRKINVSMLPTASGLVDLNTITISKSNWEGTYFEGVPIRLTAKALAGFKFHSWVVGTETFKTETIELDLNHTTYVRAIFEDAGNDGNSVVFNEINYNSPEDNNAGDWVELYNWGRDDLEISGWTFKDNLDVHQFIIPQNTTLKSGEYLVLCRNEDNFTSVHPTVSNYIGEFDFGLSSSGDAVRLYDKLNQLVDEVNFGSVEPWPGGPNGTGSTLELKQYMLDNSDVENWQASLVNLGTPGAKNSIDTQVDWLAFKDSKKQLKIYPNPFTSETAIILENAEFEPVKVEIYSMDGRLIRSGISEYNHFIWNGENGSGDKVQPGIYICRVLSDGEIYAEKIILNR